MNVIETVSEREKQVLILTSAELTTKEIATHLFLSPHTIVTHRNSLKTKLKARNVAGLIRRGFETGLLNLK